MSQACTQLRGVHLVEGAGHSIPEEQPQQVNELLLRFLRPLAAQAGRAHA
jgi:pimeloyl-ACP methyl ester carboxylesterase